MKFIHAFKNRAFTAGGIFIFSNVFLNFLNFVFNAYMGRVLTVEDFGLITFINTLVLLSGIFMNAVGSSVTHRVAFLSTNANKTAAFTFAQKMKRSVFIIALFLMLAWLILIPFSSKFFNVPDIRSLLFFTPIFPLVLNAVVLRGFLTGSLFLVRVSIALILEGVSKLVFAVILQALGFASFSYLAIPLSLLVSLIFLVFITRQATSDITQNSNTYSFPRRFFVAAVVTGLSVSSFLTLDLLLVKHYLLPKAAGEYALLSLAGKMIFFAGSLFNGLILTFVSRELGHGRNPNNIFAKLVWGTVGLTTLSYVAVGILGSKIMPLAFGEKVLPIIPYLPMYSLAIACFTIGSAFIIYHLARHHFAFSAMAFLSSVLLVIGIYLFHTDIKQITQVILTVSIGNLIAIIALHELQKNGRFLLRNVLDLIDIFSSIPNQRSFHKKSQRILVFNWRDTKHTYAGGAEVYIHELAKRWVKMGHSVTQFCGNDGEKPRNEIVDGVQVIRRGGFYSVYFWAFLYYALRLRGKYDVIIDSENGIPFFTPLYAKEQIYCLMFHVHQEVFRKSLPKPLAAFASILENRLMPWAYRRTKFITISESSKKEIADLDLGNMGIEIVYPGIDLRTYKPTDTKSPNPLIIYIGRLQVYKSVDVLIKSAKKIFASEPSVQVVIAGDGEERGRLEKLVEDLRLQEKITFIGKVTEREKIKLYQKAWVAVNPSLKEGWGITTIEANACGTPVVASNVPGLRDSVHNPSNGFLVEYGNSKAFALKILKLIRDNKLRKSMQKKSIAWASNFEWRESAEKSLKVIL